jgi:hypothetical protein
MAFTSFRCGVVAELAAPVTAAAGLLLGGMKDPLMTDEKGTGWAEPGKFAHDN